MAWGDLAKPSRTARKKAKRKTAYDRMTEEWSNKRAAKHRDGHRCRFPLCGCRKLGVKLDARLEASHDQHKGMGGNPAGDRSVTELLVSLCLHRHQDGQVSRHKGTLRSRYLSDRGNNGPLAWDVDAAYVLEALRRAGHALPEGGLLLVPLEYQGLNDTVEWVEVAREFRVQQLMPLADWQTAVLKQLAEMEL
jgi:hypothetical protein